jgi:LysR family hydrogen peroxide-inducible transcriptional activator
LAQVSDAQANLQREAAACQGTLVVGAIPTMAPYLLPPALEKFRLSYPDCQISVREDLTEQLAEALANNEIDCALVSTPLDDELLEIEVLADEELLVAVTARHAAAGKSHLGIADLRGQPTITLADMHCLGRQIEGFCSARHLSRRVVCRTTQMLTILELVALGVGVSMIPEMAAAADRSGRCRYLPLRPGKPTRQIAVAWRQGRTRPLAATRFIDLIRSNIRNRVHSTAIVPRSK